MAPLRVAIVGTGNIARFHAEALRSFDDDVSLVAAVDVDAERLKSFCAGFEVAGGYDDVVTMLSAVEPDLVHICTPPGLHHPQAMAALAAGSSVVVEKPPAVSLREMEELGAAQGDHGPWMATVSQHRFGSGAQRLRSAVDRGLFGRPLLAVCHTTWYREQAYFDVPWRGSWDSEGGGPTMGHGIHQMDLLAFILGEWVDVTAVAHRQARVMETEDVSMAHVSFADGAVASVVNSVVSPREESYLRFDFERATVELTHLYGYGDADWRVTPAPGHKDAVLATWGGDEPELRSGHRAQFAQVVRALRACEAPPVTTMEAQGTMQLVAGIYASAFQGRTVRRDELRPGSAFFDRMSGSGAPW